jgi:phosphonate transport system substrate-binding protein
MAQDFASVLDSLCDGSVDVSFIDHNQYLIAKDQHCVEVELTAIQFDSPTFAGQLLARTELGLETVAEMAGREFCRPGPLSVSGWAIPRLMLLAEGVDPDRDFNRVIDIGPHREVIGSLYRGECDVGATFVDAREASDIGAEVFDTISVVKASPAIPRHAIAYSTELTAADRELISSFMLELAESDGGLELLDQLFLGASGFERIDDAAYDGLRELIEAAGLTVYSHNP